VTSRPLVIAHRGASARAPENTIAAFELAVALGADMLELDVRLSADDQPVVIHDETLDRTTTGSGWVRDLSLSELKRLDAGAWRGPAFRGQRLQTLGEVLERFRDRVGFAIEIKSGSRRYPGIEERVVSLLGTYDVIERAKVLSFDPGVLAAVAALEPGLERVVLLPERSPLRPQEITALALSGARAVGLPVALATGPHLAAARLACLAVYVWTVNEPPLMDYLIAESVTGIITDTPDVLRARP
jgi:glycerophosphoryl diester phosphodiesterase